MGCQSTFWSSLEYNPRYLHMSCPDCQYKLDNSSDMFVSENFTGKEHIVCIYCRYCEKYVNVTLNKNNFDYLIDLHDAIDRRNLTITCTFALLVMIIITIGTILTILHNEHE